MSDTSKKTTTTTTGKTKLRSFVNLIAFVALVFVGITLLINTIWSKNTPMIVQVLKQIADIISYALVAYFSFNYVRGKKHWAYVLAWALSVALIVIFIVLPLVLPS